MFSLNYILAHIKTADENNLARTKLKTWRVSTPNIVLRALSCPVERKGENSGNEVAPPPIPRAHGLLQTRSQSFFPQKIRGTVLQSYGHARVWGVPKTPVMIWASPVTLTQTAKGFGNGDAQNAGMPMSVYHSNTTPPISQRKKPLERGWGDSEGGIGRQFILFQTVVFAKYSDTRRPKQCHSETANIQFSAI